MMTAPIISSMSGVKTSRPRYGREIAARRAQLGKSGTDIVNETGETIYPKLLSRIETGRKDPREITVTQMSALLKALEWTSAEFESATGVRLERFERETPTTRNAPLHIPGGLQLFINNQRPLFDLIYLQSDVTDLDSNVMSVPSRLLRWRGGIRSEATAPINRAGGPVMRDGYFYDTANNLMTEPRLETISIDGVNFSNADAYGMGFRRQ